MDPHMFIALQRKKRELIAVHAGFYATMALFGLFWAVQARDVLTQLPTAGGNDQVIVRRRERPGVRPPSRVRLQWLAAISALIFCVWTISDTASARDETVPMSLVDNRAFVQAEIDGQGPFSFLVDTGSGSSTVTPTVVKRLRLPVIREDHGGGAGEQIVTYSDVRVTSLTVGDVSVGPLSVPAIDLSQLIRIIGFRKCDGVLGSEIFQQHVITFDVENLHMTINASAAFQPPKAAVGVPIMLEHAVDPQDSPGMPVFSGEVDGISGRFEIDTGDRSSVTLYSPFWRAHHLDRAIGKTVTAMTGYGVGGPIRSIVGRLKNFEIAGLAVDSPLVRLSLQRSGAFTRSDYAGSVGMGFLKHFVVSFDYSHRTMWLVRTPAAGTPDSYDRSGLWLGLDGSENLEIIDVADGSPAAQAGLAVGDRVVSIDGTPANPETLFSLRTLLKSSDVKVVMVKSERGLTRKVSHLILRDQIAPAG